LCLLEITAPRGRVRRFMLRTYMRHIIPLMTLVTTGRAVSQTLWQYYWETIDACLPPESIKDALGQAGFIDVRREVSLGIFSEYTAARPS
jgi:demethylmenaquinone methyltransferase/2-methoxy-6-polyprenyl-1,4-benzoquinol methylase